MVVLRMPPLLPLLLLSFLHLLDGSVHTSDVGVSLHGPVSVVVTGSTPVLDLGSVLLTAKAAADNQADKLTLQAQERAGLVQAHETLQSDLAERIVVTQQQAQQLQNQSVTIAQQAELIVGLQGGAANITAMLTSIEAEMVRLTDRTVLAEAAVVRLSSESIQLQSELNTLDDLLTNQHAPALSNLTNITTAHGVELTRLDGVDVVIGAGLDSIAADAVVLTNRTTEIELNATILTGRVVGEESVVADLTRRTNDAEAVSRDLADAIRNHTAQLDALDITTAQHEIQITNITATGIAIQANVSLLQAHDALVATQLASLESDASDSRRRASLLESVTVDSSDLIKNVTALQARTADHTSRLDTVSTGMTIANASLMYRLSASGALTDTLTARLNAIDQRAAQLTVDLNKNATTTQVGVDATTVLLNALHIPSMHRVSFFASASWTVPAGVRGAFVTMAGAGGSGYGWRQANAFCTGASGGYVFSEPITLTPGDVMNIVVGVGGVGYRPVQGSLSSAGSPYYVFNAPTNDPSGGYYGFAGGPSYITGPTGTELIRCAGGSGMSPNSVDTLAGGGLVAGGLYGGTFGSGTPPIVVGSNPATGLYATANSPGACGANKWGVGNSGTQSYTTGYGSWPGGSTPLGYGSGGAVTRTNCYVTSSSMGLCTAPDNGRDGVIHLDIWY